MVVLRLKDASLVNNISKRFKCLVCKTISHYSVLF